MVRRMLVLGSVLALATAAAASAASSGLYRGTTSQAGRMISVQVSNGKVVKVNYDLMYGSCGGFTGQDKVALAIKNNKFSGTAHPNAETVDKLSGTFNGNNLTGTVSSTVKTGGTHGSTCKSGKVKFTAKL